MYQTKQENGTGLRRVSTTTERNVTRVKRGTNVGRLVFQLVVVLSLVLALLLTLGYDPVALLNHLALSRQKGNSKNSKVVFEKPQVKRPAPPKQEQITAAKLEEKEPEVPPPPPRNIPSLRELAKSVPPRDPHYWEDLSTHIKFKICRVPENVTALNETEIVAKMRIGMLDSLAIRVVSFPEPTKNVYTTLSTLLMSTLDRPSVNVHTAPKEDVNTTAYYEGFRGLLRGHVMVTPSMPEDTPISVLERINYAAAMKGFLQKQEDLAKIVQAEEEENAAKRRPVRGVLLLRDSVRILPHGLERIYANVHILERSGNKNYVLNCGAAQKGTAPTSSEDFNLVTTPEGISQCMFVPTHLVEPILQSVNATAITSTDAIGSVVAKWLRDQPKPIPWISMATPAALPLSA